MSIANRFWVWRYPITEVWRSTPSGRKFAWIPLDYTDWPLSYDCFWTGPSDYDTASDEVYCPCDATLPSWDGTAGHLLRLIDHHCAEAGHPKPRHEP